MCLPLEVTWQSFLHVRLASRFTPCSPKVFFGENVALMPICWNHLELLLKIVHRCKSSEIQVLQFRPRMLLNSSLLPFRFRFGYPEPCRIMFGWLSGTPEAGRRQRYQNLSRSMPPPNNLQRNKMNNLSWLILNLFLNSPFRTDCFHQQPQINKFLTNFSSFLFVCLWHFGSKFWSPELLFIFHPNMGNCNYPYLGEMALLIIWVNFTVFWRNVLPIK